MGNAAITVRPGRAEPDELYRMTAIRAEPGEDDFGEDEEDD